MTEPMTPHAAQVRLAQYGERTKTWSTATYDSGTEKALHEIASALSAEVDRLRAERDALKERLHKAAMTRTWRNEDGKKFVFVEDIVGPLLGRDDIGRAE